MRSPPTNKRLVPSDAGLLGTWFHEHRGIFEKVARSFGRGETEVGELRQEMLYQLWLALPRFAGQSKPSTWVYRVCLNTALTWRRGTDRRERRIEPGHDFEAVAAQTHSPAESVEAGERLEQLYAALRAMPETDRALLMLMLDGLDYREIAEVTGMTENHVGVALTRARRRLVAQMKGVVDELG